MTRAVLFFLVLAACQPAAPVSLDHDEPFAVFTPAELAGRLSGDGRTETFTLSGPALRLGVLWDATGPTSVEARFSDDGQTFGSWASVTVVFDEPEAHAGHVDVPAGATSVQLRLRGEISFVSLEEIHELGEPNATALELEPLPAIGRTRQALAPFPTILSRAAWGARAPTCSSPTTPYRAAIHHSVSPTNDSLPAEQRLRQIQSFHMDSRGYCDVGYNYLMTRDARVWTGRGATVLGGHAANANTGNVGICVVGTYTTDQPTAQQMCAGAGFLAWVHSTYNVPLNRTAMRGHREYGQTACPGDALFARLNEMVMLAANGCGGAPPAPAWRAEFVSQTFPASQTAAVTITQGEVLDGFFELRNTGTQTWTTATTRLAPTPRDQASPLAASNWLSPSRVSGPLANTPPGQVGRFPARLAGNTVGSVTQTFGLLHEGVAWFSDPNQGGPADTFLAVRVNVVPRPAQDAGAPGPDAGVVVPVDAGTVEPLDAGVEQPADAGSEAPGDAGVDDHGSNEEDTGGEEVVDDVVGSCSAAPMGSLATALALLGLRRRRRSARS
ncbi:MAG: N-acetylmuramoyl-L-alanine amidase [Myxococcaceae bacterium]|nr:N-acetylmuramoyl-L-alanine amidase [Myxococcaceae bacterium]